MTTDEVEGWERLACGLYEIPPKEMRDALAALREVAWERDALKMEIDLFHNQFSQQVETLGIVAKERDALRERVAELEEALRLKQIDLHCVISANEQFQQRMAKLERQTEENEASD